MMREGLLQHKLVRILKDQGCWVFNVHGGAMQASGIPDLYISHKHWKGFLELKVLAPVQPNQRIAIQEIRKTGTPAYVLKLRQDRFHIIKDLVSMEPVVVFDDLRLTLATLIELDRKSHMKGLVDALKAMGVEPTISGNIVSWHGCKMRFDDEEEVVLNLDGG